MDENNSKVQVAKPAPKQRALGQAIVDGAKAWAPTKGQTAAAAIALLTISNVFAWVKITELQTSPEIMTVGIRQLTTNYMAQLAMADISPEEVAVRTELYLSVTQDTLRKAAENRHVLLIAREAVLAGEAPDVTEQVEAAVQAAMKEATARRGAPQQAQPKSEASGSLPGFSQ
ncbi:hypothetical protein QOZ96_003349 [Brevundimonas nasdae]|uniref:TrbI F-type domain-containing protein n=1 Tax=Brevundimonas nasdae TaxID=172043 RepID=UPI00191230AE|nr:TrbI F-type domain-containing protein [Brevundimonas nasdae]MBK6026814.1 TrbI F-type domain-containing protein [Brevundimonas nasdae]MDQ0453379.1 hypothetical protein [Brevundimonas nasdae]